MTTSAPVAAHHREHARRHVRRMAQIRVDHADDRRAGAARTRRRPRCRARASRPDGSTRDAILSREVVGDRAGAVGRVVVDDHQLAVDPGARRSRGRSRGPDRPAARARCRWERRSRARPEMRRATDKDETRKHYKPVARALMPTRLVPGARRRAAAAARCRPSCSRWAPTRASMPTSASASSPASCPTAMPGIRSRRPSITPTPSCARVWPGDAAVGGADLLAAAAVAWLLFRLGRALGSPRRRRRQRARSSCCCRTRRSPGWAASGCARSAKRSSRSRSPPRFCSCSTAARRSNAAAARLARASLFGLAFLFKYNAGIYAGGGTCRGLAVAADRLAGRPAGGRRVRAAAWRSCWRCSARAARCAISTTRPSPTTCAIRAKPTRARAAALRYLLTFPIERARVDALWTVGGAGCLVLLLLARQRSASGSSRRSGSRRPACRSPSTAAAACRSISCRPTRRSRSRPDGRRSKRGRCSGPGPARRAPALGLAAVLRRRDWRVARESVPQAGRADDVRRALRARPHRSDRPTWRAMPTTASTRRWPSPQLAETVRARDAAPTIRSTCSGSPARPTSRLTEPARRGSSGAAR